uniref:Cation efflux protein cytoplasmic domain-containing protein n=1 Tax=Scophthalmus maximus TaxID=52904 RepID=A0A8D3ASJ0_SCOMX
MESKVAFFRFGRTDHIQGPHTVFFFAGCASSTFQVAGMRMTHWCMLGVTILLLACEVAISQLCKSVITLLDGFHTLFILLQMATRHPLTAPSSSGAATDATSPTPLPLHDGASPFNSNPLCPPTVSPPALICGVSFFNSRIPAVGSFMSSLLLASLGISYLLQSLKLFLMPAPVQLPLLLVVVGSFSLLLKMLWLGLNWDKLQEEMTGASRQPETHCHVEVNHRALAAEEAKGPADDVSLVQSAADDSLHNGALLFCNPGASSVPDIDPQSPQQLPEVFAELEVCKCESLSKDITETSKDETSMGHLDTQNASITFQVCKSSHPSASPVPNSQQPVCLQSLLVVAQGLFTSLLALFNGLVMLRVDPQCLPGSEACGLLFYLDPGLSLLAVLMLIATATPQVHRYGLLLLQATPPHICVSDLEQRIAGVPGVETVHDLHVWQLTESFVVASVHVRCHARFPTHRCADLMLGVTKVLQSVGVRCCTVQPEFAPCSAGMCCPILKEECRSTLAPPAGKTTEQPYTKDF